MNRRLRAQLTVANKGSKNKENRAQLLLRTSSLGHRPEDGRQFVHVFTLLDCAVLHGLAVAQHLPIHTRQRSQFGIILGHDHPVHRILYYYL